MKSETGMDVMAGAGEKISTIAYHIPSYLPSIHLKAEIKRIRNVNQKSKAKT